MNKSVRRCAIMKICDFQDAENALHFRAWQESNASHYILAKPD